MALAVEAVRRDRSPTRPLPTVCAALLGALVWSGLAGCASRSRTTEGPPAWRTWQAERRESVAGENGWATLAGLHWLAAGTSTLGTHPTNQLVLPAGHAPAHAGRLVRSGSEVRFVAGPGVSAARNGQSVVETALLSDAGGATPDVLAVNRLRLTVIQRGERLGLRVRDPDAPTRRHFQGLDYFAHDPRWRFDGHWEPAPDARVLAIQDVTGRVNDEPSPGTVVFSVDGHEQRLAALDDLETHDLFILFRDATAGKTTYGPGRFLHVAKPGPDGRLVIDFNYAYNPPCAFTPFATCPIPPRQNWLSIPIEAGEQRYRGGHP